MKKIITALAVAAFGVSAFAQEASVPAPERNFVVGAKFDFESRYVTQGKRRVNENTQTTISFKYFVPQTSDIGITPYADFLWMSPTDNQRNGHDLSNEGSLTLGSEIAVGDVATIDFGYKYTGWNDRASAAAMNRAYINRSNEIFVGVNKTLSLIDGNEYGDIDALAYVRYNFNTEELSYELGLEKTFSWEEVGLRLAAVYGYVDANDANGDQGGGNIHNDYGYIAVSADLSYQINSWTDVGVGVRYAYNNDGDDSAFTSDNNDDNLWWGAWIRFRY